MQFGGTLETLLVASDEGGRKSPPTAHGALGVYYQHPEHTMRSEGSVAAMKAGAMGVWVSYTPPGSPATPSFVEDDATQRYVTVRGRKAYLTEANFRQILFVDRLPDGGSTSWQFVSDPHRYTTEEAVAWADSLREL